MKIVELFTNKGHSVGIVRVTESERKEMKRVVGYFNKELLREMTELFELFEIRDMPLYFYERDGAALLLFSPNEKKDIYISVAGKTEMIE